MAPGGERRGWFTSLVGGERRIDDRGGRGGRFAISQRIRWDINLEAETWSAATYHVFRWTASVHESNIREKREFLLSPSFPPLSPAATPTDLDHNANSRSVTSRCLRNKYHCSGRLDRTRRHRRATLERNAPCPKCYLVKEIVQWAIFKVDRGARCIIACLKTSTRP